MVHSAYIEAVFTGKPRRLTDARGTWVSSIHRDRAHGAVPVSLVGLAGDAVAQPYHGGPDAVLCVHLLEHYAFWNDRFAMNLQAGSVGENITLAGLSEDQVCAGDRVRVGSALVQVSGPRVPCANLARRIGRPDWVQLTIRENRTGFYLRVLEPGLVQQGDRWSLEERLNETGSIAAINRCMYLHFDPGYARAMLTLPGLGAWWKEQAREKLARGSGHWTSAMTEGSG